MKMTIIAANTKKPLVNSELQLQVRGKDSGFLSVKTDQQGQITLDDKYKGQQILVINDAKRQSITVADKATLTIDLMGANSTNQRRERQPISSK